MKFLLSGLLLMVNILSAGEADKVDAPVPSPSVIRLPSQVVWGVGYGDEHEEGIAKLIFPLVEKEFKNFATVTKEAKLVGCGTDSLGLYAEWKIPGGDVFRITVKISSERANELTKKILELVLQDKVPKEFQSTLIHKAAEIAQNGESRFAKW